MLEERAIVDNKTETDDYLKERDCFVTGWRRDFSLNLSKKYF